MELFLKRKKKSSTLSPFKMGSQNNLPLPTIGKIFLVSKLNEFGGGLDSKSET